MELIAITAIGLPLKCSGFIIRIGAVAAVPSFEYALQTKRVLERLHVLMNDCAILRK